MRRVPDLMQKPMWAFGALSILTVAGCLAQQTDVYNQKLELQKSIRESKTELQKSISESKAELKNEMDSIVRETRARLREDIKQIRELELAALRGDVEKLAHEEDKLRRAQDDFRNEIKTEQERLRSDVDQLRNTFAQRGAIAEPFQAESIPKESSGHLDKALQDTEARLDKRIRDLEEQIATLRPSTKPLPDIQPQKKEGANLLLPLPTIPAEPGKTFTAAEIAKQFTRSIVTIIALDDNEQPLGIGSGFFINDSGHLATNYHVLEGASHAVVKTTDGKVGEIREILALDPDLDMLVAASSFHKSEPLRLGDSSSAQVGESIVVIGNPSGLEGTVSTGIVSAVRTVEKLKFIQITAPISPGSSGGPVFSMTGRVIGMATAYLTTGQNLNFAMPIEYLRTLRTKQIAITSLPKRRTQESTAIAEKSAVEIYDIHYDTMFDGTGTGVDFVIANNHRLPIQKIHLFFVYKNKDGKVVSYSQHTFPGPILPKLALQFSHRHTVKHFTGGKVDIRILDFDIHEANAAAISGK